jgi:hypothetical protein
VTELNNWAGTRYFTPQTVLKPPSAAAFPRHDIRDALDAGQTVRIVGSLYSFSDCMVCDGLVVVPPPSSPNDIKLACRPNANGLAPLSDLPFLNPAVAWNGAEPAGYAWIPWSTIVDDLCKACGPAGLSPYTLGGSSGQRVVGAVSTSTHGADFNEFPLPEYVEAVQVFTGDTDVWIERERPEGPLTLDGPMLAWMGTPGSLLRSTDALNAALVSFGAAGAIVGALLRLRGNPEMIERYVEDVPWQTVRAALLSGSAFAALPGEAASSGGTYRYLEVLLNAYGPNPVAFVCGRNERPWLGASLGLPHRQGTDTIRFIELAGAGKPDRQAALNKLLEGSRLNGGWYRFLDVLDVGVPSPLAVYSWELVWDCDLKMSDGTPAYVAFLDRAIQVIQQQGDAPYIGTISLRFTRGTCAYLGMQSTATPAQKRFAQIELSALQDVLNGTRDLPADAGTFLSTLLADPSAGGATLHWGQGAFEPQKKFDASRFSSLAKWKTQVNALLGPRASQFQTPFTRKANAIP